MGYSHYWEIGDAVAWEEAFPQVVLDAKRIVEHVAGQGLVIRNGLGEGKPQFTEGRININGDASSTEDDYEDFTLECKPGGSWFCKTGEYPYDRVVVAILLRASALCPTGIAVRSDGTWTDWTEGRTLYADVFGEKAKRPELVRA